MIKAYLKGEQKEWDRHLGCLAGAYRATIHESTGFSPNMLMFGREVKLPAQIMYNSPDDEEFTSYGDFVAKLRERMDKAHEVARQHLQQAAKRRKELYDAKACLHHFKVGDMVWYASDLQQFHITPKLRKTFMGPVVIVKKYSELTYMIQLDSKGSKKVVHHDKILPYQGSMRPKWMKKAVKNMN